jgi:signal transduction histidine kinase
MRLVESSLAVASVALEALPTGTGWAAAAVAGLAAARMRMRLVQRSVLVARAAHEVRGPLAAAGLALHGAADDPGRVAAAELQIRRAGLALADLVDAPDGVPADDLRELLDARAVVAEVVDAWSPVAQRYGAAVRVEAGEAPVPVHADRFRLAQAVANLVVNAAEHGQGDVVVRVEANEQSVWIAVGDHGRGPALERVAGAVRLGRRSGARGHGLAIVAGVAARHNGRLFVVPADADAGVLASVVLELPRIVFPRSLPSRQWGPLTVRVRPLWVNRWIAWRLCGGPSPWPKPPGRARPVDPWHLFWRRSDDVRDRPGDHPPAPDRPDAATRREAAHFAEAGAPRGGGGGS